MEERLAEQMIDRFTLAAFCEACRLLDEGVSSMKEIDIAMMAGAGYPKGPFALADDMGLDVVLAKLEALQRFGDAFYISDKLRAAVGRGDLGVKTGKGFYEY